MYFKLLVLFLHFKIVFLDELNVGTVLFSPDDTDKKCWNNEKLALLKARLIYQDILPQTSITDLENDEFLNTLIQYFHLAVNKVKRLTDAPVKRINLMAMCDVLGGYFRSNLIPLTKRAFYTGTINYETAEDVFKFYDDIRSYLNTDGLSWAPPSKKILQRSIQNLEPEKLLSDNKTNHCEDLTITNHNGFIHIPTPHLTASVITMPLKQNAQCRINQKNCLKQFYETARKCLDEKHASPENIKKFNRNFETFLDTKVFPHVFNDERIYPAFGGVFRIKYDINHEGKYPVIRELVEDDSKDDDDNAPIIVIVCICIVTLIWLLITLCYCCKNRRSHKIKLIEEDSDSSPITKKKPKKGVCCDYHKDGGDVSSASSKAEPKQMDVLKVKKPKKGICCDSQKGDVSSASSKAEPKKTPKKPKKGICCDSQKGDVSSGSSKAEPRKIPKKPKKGVCCDYHKDKGNVSSDSSKTEPKKIPKKPNKGICCDFLQDGDDDADDAFNVKPAPCITCKNDCPRKVPPPKKKICCNYDDEEKPKRAILKETKPKQAKPKSTPVDDDFEENRIKVLRSYQRPGLTTQQRAGSDGFDPEIDSDDEEPKKKCYICERNTQIYAPKIKKCPKCRKRQCRCIKTMWSQLSNYSVKIPRLFPNKPNATSGLLQKYTDLSENQTTQLCPQCKTPKCKHLNIYGEQSGPSTKAQTHFLVQMASVIPKSRPKTIQSAPTTVAKSTWFSDTNTNVANANKDEKIFIFGYDFETSSSDDSSFTDESLP